MTSPVTQYMHKSRLHAGSSAQNESNKRKVYHILPWNTDEKANRTKQNETTYLLLETALYLWILLLHAMPSGKLSFATTTVFPPQGAPVKLT